MPSKAPNTDQLPDLDGLLTKQETADLVRFSTKTIDRMDREKGPRRRGFPYPIRIRGRKRWRRSDILEWIRDQA